MLSSSKETSYLVTGTVGVIPYGWSPSEAGVINNYCESELTFIEFLACARNLSIIVNKKLFFQNNETKQLCLAMQLYFQKRSSAVIKKNSGQVHITQN